MCQIRSPGTQPVHAAALAVAVFFAHAGAAAAGDCAPSEVLADIKGRSLTPAEKIARLDAALSDSLARFDACQSAASAAAEGNTGTGSAAGGATGSGVSGLAGAGTSGLAGAAGRAGSPEAGEPAPGGAVESVAAAGIAGTEPDDGAADTPPGPERPPDRGFGSGPAEVPEDIPAPDNDSVLEAQIRRAAMEETDPRLRAELWNEYRKYKGLPPRPLPDDDGGPSDAQDSQ